MHYKPLPSKERLHALFSYNIVEGALYWKAPNANNVKPGQLAGSKKNTGYYRVMVDGIYYQRHRLIWAYHYDDPGSMDLDHRNRIKGDDRIENLRLATNSQNKCNVVYAVGRSGVRGVYWNKQKRKWKAKITHQNRDMYLGYFDDIKEAEKAYKAAALQLHGDFALPDQEAA